MHTPGPRTQPLTPVPWTLQRCELYEEGSEGTGGWKVVGADGQTVCDNQTYYPHAVSLADARLIAAAPDLFAALLKCAPTGCAYDAPQASPRPAVCHCAGCDARTAITKATETEVA